MEYISVKDAAFRFGISERRVQKLCEEKRIPGAQMLSKVWLIPSDAQKPLDERMAFPSGQDEFMSLKDLCNYLSVSVATGRNWIKLNKITPTTYDNGHPFFSRAYCENLKVEIRTGKNTALKSRRNKKYVSGSSFYRAYVSDESRNLSVVEAIVNDIDSEHLEVTEFHLRALTAECALQLLNQKYHITDNKTEYLLSSYLKQDLAVGKYYFLIDDLIRNCNPELLLSFSRTSLFRHAFIYEESEDIVGLLYISCKNISSRKATGAYYTPTKVVKELISGLSESRSLSSSSLILDPCCGTGNFLLQLPCTAIDMLFGIDIDEISVQLTRINMALKFPNCTKDQLYTNFQVADYLSYARTGFNLILGNPPWGFDYDDERKTALRRDFQTAQGKTIESYDLFIEQSLRKMRPEGTMAFVLPEAILNVKIHQPIREMILKGHSISRIHYLGNAFDQVQCPCIILQIRNTGKPFNTQGMQVICKDDSFEIKTSRNTSAGYFSFQMKDDEWSVLNKIENVPNCQYLKDHAVFALGLVTGNNKKYISDVPQEGYEIVLKGSDICRYRIVPHGNYLSFRPEEFQQVAPVEYYRTPEKLFYRFICKQLVFAYDDHQTLSLNSCNILIPELQGVSMKYSMAILNSRVAQFLFSKKFQSVKVLKSHIEQIPIPAVDAGKQGDITSIVDLIIDEKDPAQITGLYNQLDKIIANLFQLTSDEYGVILKATENDSLFLC